MGVHMTGLLRKVCTFDMKQKKSGPKVCHENYSLAEFSNSQKFMITYHIEIYVKWVSENVREGCRKDWCVKLCRFFLWDLLLNNTK